VVLKSLDKIFVKQMVRNKISPAVLKAGELIPSTVLATQAIANVVKSSFGPSGLDKMMVDGL